MTEKPENVSDYQWNFLKIRGELGEKEANLMLANRLRELAETVLDEGYPRVFGFSEEKEGPMTTFTITLSLPWGG